MTIFISYAREDVAFARDLYLNLEGRGLEPWMDKPPDPFHARGLIPGEDWRARLGIEIGRARRAILVLSEISIKKVGYVQREFRLVLDAMNQMPPGTRFAIPLLIDDCDPPELVVGSISLSNLNWTSLNDINLGRFIDMIEADMRA